MRGIKGIIRSRLYCGDMGSDRWGGREGGMQKHILHGMSSTPAGARGSATAVGRVTWLPLVELTSCGDHAVQTHVYTLERMSGGCAVLKGEHIPSTGVLHDERIGGMGGVRAVPGLGAPAGREIARMLSAQVGECGNGRVLSERADHFTREQQRDTLRALGAQLTLWRADAVHEDGWPQRYRVVLTFTGFGAQPVTLPPQSAIVSSRS